MRSSRFAASLVGAVVLAALVLVLLEHFAPSGNVRRDERDARKAEVKDEYRGQGVSPMGVDEDTAEALAELGYAEWVSTDMPEVSGVTIHDRERAWRGLNLYRSTGSPRATLVDMEGRIVHTWLAPGYETVEESGVRKHHDGPWMLQTLLPGGELLGITRHRYIEKVDWDSTPLWRTDVPAHHDFDLDAQGRILALTKRKSEMLIEDEMTKIIDNGIAILSPEGELLDEIWFSSLLADRVQAVRDLRREQHARQGPDEEYDPHDRPDVFHANTLEVLPRDVPGLGNAGDVLISLRRLDLVLVVDLDVPRVVWSWGVGELEGQHQPTLLDNDHLLIFDNGMDRKWSRVIEVDPVTQEIVWEYSADPPFDFFSKTRGGSEQLPNGNILVTESNRGRVFEITREGEIVWEYLNPHLSENGRGAIYRLHRLTDEERASLPLGDS